MENIAEQTSVEEVLNYQEEEFGEMEETNNKFKEVVTNRNVQIGAAASSITGIVGFLLGQAHEQRVQKKLMDEVRKIVGNTQQLLLQTITEPDRAGILKEINYAITGNYEEETIELKEVKGELQDAVDLSLEEIERLNTINKFNIIARRRAKEWIELHKELLGLITTLVTVVELRTEALESIFKQYEKEMKEHRKNKEKENKKEENK